MNEPTKPAEQPKIDLMRLINPGYGIKSYPAVGGGLKAPKPIDPAHVPNEKPCK